MTTFRFKGVIGTEGELTGDGRMIEPGALQFDTPVPLMFAREALGAHQGSVVVGQFTSISRNVNDIVAEGEFLDVSNLDPTSELRQDVETAITLVASGAAPGVSMDLDDVTFRVEIAKSLLEGTEPEENGDRIVMFKGSPEDEVAVIEKARIRGATLVSKPAFANAKIEVFDNDGVVEATDENNLSGLDLDAVLAEDCACNLVAAAPPDHLIDANAFERQMTAPTRLTVTDDGQVYGHIALWDTCHIGFANACTTPPPSNSDYAYFHTHDYNGMPVGVLTVGGGHADPSGNYRAAIEHYDDVATVWAYVRAHEDEHGIAVSGVVAKNIDPDTLALAKSRPPSGDWRRIGGSLELVACCSVNTPGFPVVAASGGKQLSLVAAGPGPVNADIDPVLPEPLLRRVIDQALAAADEHRKFTAEAEALLADVADSYDDIAASLFSDVHGV